MDCDLKNTLDLSLNKYERTPHAEMDSKIDKDLFNKKCDELMEVFTDTSEIKPDISKPFVECVTESAKQIEFDSAMPDLEAASKSHIATRNTDVDIEEETANIMGEVEVEETSLKTQKNSGMVFQIIKEEGNLRMKPLGEEPRPSDAKQKTVEERSRKSQRVPILKKEVHFEINSSDEKKDRSEQKLLGKDLFLCCVCNTWYSTLKQLLSHIKENHKELEIPKEYERLLYKQRKAILKIETTAKELINMKKYEAVSKLLESSKNSLENLNLDLFGQGDINIFEKFVSDIYTRIRRSLVRHKKKIKEKSKKNKKENKELESRKKRKKVRTSPRKKDIKFQSQCDSDGFSSDDDICLKNILKVGDGNIKSDGEVIDPEMENVYCLQFYAVPYVEGKTLNAWEVDAVRSAIKKLWNGESIDTDNLAHIKIKRHEIEADEILPDDTLFRGFLAKENKPLLDGVHSLFEVFDHKGTLTDQIRTHKPMKVNLSIEFEEQKPEIADPDVNTDANVETTVVIEDSAVDVIPIETDTVTDPVKTVEVIKEDTTKNDDFFDDITTNIMIKEDSNSSDDYDDGFYQATEFLTENREALFQRKRTDICKICGDRFATRTDFNSHVALHKVKFVSTVRNRCTCSLCSCEIDKINILRHYEKYHKYSIQCEVCCSFFANFDSRVSHFSRHTNMTCGVCSKEFTELFQFRDHFQDEHVDRRVVKKEEVEHDENFGTYVNAQGKPNKVRKFSIHSDNAPACPTCERRFTSVGRLEQHVAVAHHGGPFKKHKPS